MNQHPGRERHKSNGNHADQVSAESGVTRYSTYDRFASIYNDQFGSYAGRVMPVLERLLLQHLPRNASLLDLCCGTGQLAGALLEQGFSVTGIDGSEQMLGFARRNASAAHFELNDARTMELEPVYHGAVSTFDSMNHILSLDELRMVFLNVFRGLQPGGIFLFDMNMEQGFGVRWWGQLHGVETDCRYVIDAVYDPEKRLGHNIVTFFDDASGRQSEIRFTERCYTETEISDCLDAAGFHDVRVFDGHCDLDLFGEIGRSFFVCRKPGKLTGSPINVRRPRVVTRTTETPLTVPATGQQQRELATCLADSLWPTLLNEPTDGISSLRLRAIAEVLCRLPSRAYAILKQQASQFQWFIPSVNILGQVHPFGASETASELAGGTIRSRVVYLSPLLEQHDWEVVITVVAHELAHVILHHRLEDLDDQSYQRQEQESRAAVSTWGFGQEAEHAERILRQIVLSNGAGNLDRNPRRPNFSSFEFHSTPVSES